MFGLIWVQTVWHFDHIPERILSKCYLEKNQQTTKNIKKYQAAWCKELIDLLKKRDKRYIISINDFAPAY